MMIWLTCAGPLSHLDLLATYMRKDKHLGVQNMPLSYFPLHFVPASVVLKASIEYSIHSVNPHEHTMQPPVPFEQKTGFGSNVQVSAFISNCANAGASKRAAYLFELTKLIPGAHSCNSLCIGLTYLPVHNYGSCHKNAFGEQNVSENAVPHPYVRRRIQKMKTLRQ
jgi:hypothetical protein